MPKRVISLESEVLIGSRRPRYFIDLVDITEDGQRCHGNLRVEDNITEARKVARAYADEYGCRVEDETLEIGRPV